MKLKKIKLDKKDYRRALLTDTAPSDVPIIFSNDGFYINSHRVKVDGDGGLDKLVKTIYNIIINPDSESDKSSFSSPLKYKIRKNEVSLRTLSLLHPRAQVNFSEFYCEYGNVISRLCSVSQFSIRAPSKIGNSFYSNDLDENSKYKEIDIDTLESELIRKHASSFFSYRGFDRIYKLYTDYKYIELEKKYPFMRFMDVANCFDSIYTHTISWAVKNKEFIKKHTRYSSQFCQKFDTLVQRSNNNETNGIPVGSEVSRIFSEVIFQDIDVKAVSKLKDDFGYEQDIEYTVLRYVDDFIVFAENSSVLDAVYAVLSDCLGEYNLYVSESKLKDYRRPFCTEKSNVIVGLNRVISDLESSLICKRNDGGKELVFFKSIFNSNRFVHSYVDKVKRLCLESGNGYADASSYLISVLSKRIVILNENYEQYSSEVKGSSEEMLRFRQGVLVIIRLMFFFYGVHPTVSSSNKMAKTIFIVDQFFSRKCVAQLDFVRSEVMQHISQISLVGKADDMRDGYVSLERLNIVLASSGFGENYLIPVERFSDLLDSVSTLTYFDMVSLLFYFKDHKQYEGLVERLELIAYEKLSGDFDLLKNSENAHLFLDLTSCPYVSTQFKVKVLKKFYTEYETDVAKSDEELSTDISLLANTYWFVKWKGVDLIKLLERKELKSI